MCYRRPIFILGIWTLVGLFFASQIYFGHIYTTRPVSLARAIAWQMLAAYLLAFATPFVLWLARRFPIERQNWGRRFLIHMVAGTFLSIILALCHATLDVLFARGIFQVSFANLPRMVLYLLDKELVMYWLIVLISHAFNYYERYQSGELKASQLEAQLAQSQLQALKMQLHPHFLFNTLNAIAELIYKKPESAELMVTQLSDMLRLSLDKVGVQEVSLKQELEFLQRYLEIEQTRFAERLRVSMEIQPDALHASVPNMILQPLVENAVRHGIAPRSGGGHIEIRAHRSNGMLNMEVRDDGRGMSEPSTSRGGVGLANTRARLHHLYGANAYRFVLKNGSGRGLTVSLAIPFRESATGDDGEDTGFDRR